MVLEGSGEEVEGRSPLFNSVGNKPPVYSSILIPSFPHSHSPAADTDQALSVSHRKVGSKQGLQQVCRESLLLHHTHGTRTEGHSDLDLKSRWSVESSQ